MTGSADTAGVVLRAVVESDLAVLYEQQRDPVATAMAAFVSRDHDTFMARWHQIMTDDATVARTIEVEGGVGGAVAGHIVCWVHDGHHEIGYWLGREFWGRGIGSAAVRAFLAEVTARPLYAFVAEHNVGSRRVLEKAGFAEIRRQPSDDGLDVVDVVFRLDDVPYGSAS